MPVRSDIALNGAPVTSGYMNMNLGWYWTSDVEIVGDTNIAPGTAVDLSIRTTVWRGTVINSGDTYGKPELRIVGGAGGLGTKQIEAREYKQTTLAEVFKDVLADAGETAGNVSVGDNVPLAHWMRSNDLAAKNMRRLNRVFPDNVIMQIEKDGSFSLREVDWATSWKLDLNQIDDHNFSDEFASIYAVDGSQQPGYTFDINGSKKRVSKLMYTFRPNLRISAWFIL